VRFLLLIFLGPIAYAQNFTVDTLLQGKADSLTTVKNYEALNVGDKAILVEELNTVVYPANGYWNMATQEGKKWTWWRIKDAYGQLQPTKTWRLRKHQVAQFDGEGEKELLLDWLYSLHNKTVTSTRKKKTCWRIADKKMIFELYTLGVEESRLDFKNHTVIRYLNPRGDTVKTLDAGEKMEDWNAEYAVEEGLIHVSNFVYGGSSMKTWAEDFKLKEEACSFNQVKSADKVRVITKITSFTNQAVTGQNKKYGSLPEWVLTQAARPGNYRYREGMFIWEKPQ